MMRLGPHSGTKAKDNVTAEQGRKKHNFSRQKKPHNKFASRERQTGLILEDWPMVSVTFMANSS
jgi:hypothetical protein